MIDAKYNNQAPTSAAPGKKTPLALMIALSFSAAAVASDETQTTPADATMTVHGRALSLYRAQETAFATRTPTAIDDTPQSIQVLPRQLIEDQAARQITDLYRSMSGVSQYNYSYVTFRGFRQDHVLYDGVRGDPFEGLSIPQLFNIERVEVLKGPAAAVMGSGEPGGTINYTTKKPTYATKRHVAVTGGNQDFASAQVELSGSANAEQSQRYRLGIYQDHENPYRQNTDTRNRIIDLGYEWDAGDDTTIGLQYINVTQHIGGGRIRGIPTDDDGNFLAAPSWNANDASDYHDLEAQFYQVHMNHNVNDWLSGDVTFRYFENEDTQKYHESRSLKDTNSDGRNDTVTREYRDQLRTNKAGSVTANLVAQLDQHTILFGADYYRLDNEFTYHRAKRKDGVSDRSLTNPDYTPDDVSSYKSSLAKHTDSREERYGAYLQDQWQITDAWNVLSGVRLDGYRDEVVDVKKQTKEQYSGSGFSYRVGSTYKINTQFHPYAVIATGFVPQAAASQASDNGGPFDPEESLMYETGVRTYLFDNRVNMNVALYHITKENVLQTDPNDSDKQVAYGKVRSQGIEVDVLADLTANWVANLSYAYNDTLVKQGDEQFSNRTVGKRFANAPHNQLGLWTRYHFPAIDSSIGFGADYVSEQLTQDAQKVKSFTVYDMSWQTLWHDWKFQLNVKNLFDKSYAVSGFTEATGSFVGERRRVYLQADYSF
ncbi:Ferrichrome-iron receptor precursor [Vibrio ruber DSM 16370]|uniref:Ferrichrome-iron receptor n=1 Tax=Vibrio ruber (strain DSM 16370 / JCM 11486 / BCRC 17186 / CECT 7878 / LMG 23124 / VR1) TaxID=1123498 RepID=A0A1R4LPG3_VIBR1|nr:TonB-dependent receptor [Vibrio ruber]SJN58164.1 Ferrichrome-iron receptor precursor [Vibrio ruber DSM 16370]